MIHPIDTAPKDRPVLVHFPPKVIKHPKLADYVIKGGWIQAMWDDKFDWNMDEDDGKGGYVGGWVVLSLPVHGCGCCTSQNQTPDYWMELPDAMS